MRNLRPTSGSLWNPDQIFEMSDPTKLYFDTWFKFSGQVQFNHLKSEIWNLEPEYIKNLALFSKSATKGIYFKTWSDIQGQVDFGLSKGKMPNLDPKWGLDQKSEKVDSESAIQKPQF